MKNILTVSAVWLILGAAVCGAAPGETGGAAASAVMDSTAPTDSSATAAPRYYREAEPVLRAAAREHPRPAMSADAPQRGMRVLVHALLLAAAAFAVSLLSGMRRTGRSGNGEKAAHVRERRRARAEIAAPEARVEQARPPQTPRERAERLKARRDQVAAEIERLMKRV